MPFERNLSLNLTPEWESKYLDYKRLKDLCRNLRKEKQEKKDYSFDVFYNTFEEEVQKVNEFFKEKEENFNNRHQDIEKSEENFDDFTSSQKTTLKIAYQEHYRALTLLKNFRILNFAGFVKVLTKVEKITKSPILNEIMDDTIEKYATFFHQDDLKKSESELTVPINNWRKNRSGMFGSGLFIGLSLTLTFVTGVLYFRNFPSDYPHANAAFFLFRILVWPPIMIIFLALNIRIWSNTGINYSFIFEFDARNQLSFYQLLHIGSMLYFLWIFSCGFYVWSVVNESLNLINFYGYSFITPIVLLCVYIFLLVNPLDTMFRYYRYSLIKILWRLLCAPFYEVRFIDFWLADQLTSTGFWLFNLQFIFCFDYDQASDQFFDLCNIAHNTGLPIFSAFPFYCRFMQCLRKFYDTKDLWHLLNAGKYMSSILVVVLTFTNGKISHSWTLIVWITANVFSTIYKFYWDIHKDWGLLQKCNLLREKAMFHPLIYYFSILLNLVLRVIWIPFFVFEFVAKTYKITNLPKDQIYLFAIAFMELFRRFVWNIFRLENEHLNNREKYRAIRDVPLPIYPSSNLIESDNMFKRMFCFCCYSQEKNHEQDEISSINNESNERESKDFDENYPILVEEK
eukprot:gene8154-12615_t